MQNEAYTSVSKVQKEEKILEKEILPDSHPIRSTQSTGGIHCARCINAHGTSSVNNLSPGATNNACRLGRGLSRWVTSSSSVGACSALFGQILIIHLLLLRSLLSTAGSLGNSLGILLLLEPHT